MNNRTLVLILCSALLGASGGFLLGQRRATPADAHDDVDTQALLTQIDDMEQDRQHLRDELRKLEDMPNCDGEAAPRATATSTATARPSAVVQAPAAQSRSRELPLDQRKIMARQRNGQLFRELGLSEQQVDALLDVLAAQDARAPSNSRRIGGPPFGRLGPSADATSPEELQRNRDEIASAIGPEKAAQFEALKKTLPARDQLQQLRNELERAGDPVTDEQQRRLLAIMNSRETTAPPARVEGESPEESMARYREWRRESSESLRRDAASVLTPDQVKRMEESDGLRTSLQSRTSAVPGTPSMIAPGAAGSGSARPARTN
jgi:hypothetical protein